MFKEGNRMADKVDLVLTDPPYGAISLSGSAATRPSGNMNGVGRSTDLELGYNNLPVLYG
jgi:hypothetical protein